MKRRKARSKTKNVQQREKKWITNFQIVCSRDNEVLPKYDREFFDKPLSYNVHGRRMKLECTYEPKKTPVIISTQLPAANASTSVWETIVKKNKSRTVSKSATQKNIISLLRRVKHPEAADVILFLHNLLLYHSNHSHRSNI